VLFICVHLCHLWKKTTLQDYIAYLLSRYYEYKKADVSYGADPVKHARVMNGLYPAMNNTIRAKFGAYPNGLPEMCFPELVLYMKEKNDGTFLGKSNVKKGRANYKSPENIRESAPDGK